jgi:uncharacterized membrane protein
MDGADAGAVGLMAWFEEALHGIATVFEAGGVAVMLAGLLLALVQAARKIARGVPPAETYHPFRVTLAKSILLGLEFLVAADIIGTVAVEPTIDNLLVLGLIVVIRTALSFALQIEISGRLPWRAGDEPPR